MKYTDLELQECIDNLPVFRDQQQKNLFNVGTRGFYENPFTNVLAYLLNHDTEYKHKEEFLEILLTGIVPEEVITDLMQNRSTSTQYTTFAGNRIDMLLFGQRYLLVFENKIFHHLNNPLQDYEDDVSLRYPRLKKYFIIMSYKKENPPAGWTYLNIQEKFHEILENITHRYDNKWDYFVHDFLMQFSNKYKFRMEENNITFFENNFSKIIDARKRLGDFVQGVAEQIKDQNSNLSYKINDKWGNDELAIRFYPCGNENNVTLIFTKDECFNVAIYYYADFKMHGSSIHSYVGPENYEMWNEGTVSCFVTVDSVSFNRLLPALNEVQKQLDLMVAYFENKNMSEAANDLQKM